MKKMGIKSKIFMSFLIFTVLIMGLLWLFQTVFLDDFYKWIKKNEIVSVSKKLSDEKDSENLNEIVLGLSQNYQVCILVWNISENGDTSLVCSSDILSDCIIHKGTEDFRYELYLDALKNGGTYLAYYDRSGFGDKAYDVAGGGNTVYVFPDNLSDSMVYIKIVSSHDNSSMVFMLNSTVSPVSATVKTLRIQLTIITFIMASLALILAFVISKILSKPIITINDTAKQLAQGNYNITFDEKGYKEISELGATLNYTTVELSKVDKLRNELIANISHDLRTPLTMIIGYGEVMRDVPNENTAENAQIIVDEAGRLSRLVSDILDISKIQAGTQMLNIEKYNFTETIRDILYHYRKITSKDGYTFEFICDTPDVFVEADKLKISQVIYNLLNNAINYTGEDKKVFVRQTITDNIVHLDIIDTGEGISEDMLPYIWDRYYKIDKNHKRASLGTGLGLSIVRKILEMHFAPHGVKSSIGKGSLFWFELKISSLLVDDESGGK